MDSTSLEEAMDVWKESKAFSVPNRKQSSSKSEASLYRPPDHSLPHLLSPPSLFPASPQEELPFQTEC